MKINESITSKLPDVGTTIFTIMSQLAADVDAINLSQGFPDFAAPDALLERVSHHLNAGRNQYAPMPGVPELREQIAIKTERLYERATDPDTEVTVTSATLTPETPDARLRTKLSPAKGTGGQAGPNHRG